MKQLAAFDAVMRQNAITSAATELDLTQSNVSRLILALEDQLGTALFIREKRRLVPTAAAKSYHVEVSKALDTVARATMSVVTNPTGGTISLAVLPTFATHWLSPRLNRFLSEQPGISINLSTRIARFDFETEGFDAAICFGQEPWPGTLGMKLLNERVTACASPEFKQKSPLRTEQDFIKVPLLYLETRPTAWKDWFHGQGFQSSPGAGMVMDQFSMMIQAAISSLGIALLPEYLAEIEISAGRLEPVLKPAIPVRGSYWLVWPPQRSESAPLAALKTALSQP